MPTVRLPLAALPLICTFVSACKSRSSLLSSLLQPWKPWSCQTRQQSAEGVVSSLSGNKSRLKLVRVPLSLPASLPPTRVAITTGRDILGVSEMKLSREGESDGRRLITLTHKSTAALSMPRIRKKYPHDRRKSICRECEGTGFCEHDRKRSECKSCGGSSICQHNRMKRQCRSCDGSSI